MGYLGSFKFSSIAAIYDVHKDYNTIQGLLQGAISIGGGLGALSTSIVLKNFSRRYLYSFNTEIQSCLLIL